LNRIRLLFKNNDRGGGARGWGFFNMEKVIRGGDGKVKYWCLETQKNGKKVVQKKTRGKSSGAVADS